MSQENVKKEIQKEFASKKEYVQPRLVEHGDIRDITKAALGANTDAAMSGALTPTS